MRQCAPQLDDQSTTYDTDRRSDPTPNNMSDFDF
jgi:hypothetical protein